MTCSSKQRQVRLKSGGYEVASREFAFGKLIFAARSENLEVILVDSPFHRAAGRETLKCTSPWTGR